MSDPNPEQKTELEKNPEIVKNIEDSDFGCFIEDPIEGYPDDKMNILLVTEGLKPASIIYLKTKEENGWTGDKFERTEDEVQRNISLLDRLGLFHTQGKKEVQKASWKKGAKKRFTEDENLEILIGNTQEELDDLVKALDAKDNKAIGLALGFPPTAVESFSQHGGAEKMMDKRKIKKEATPEELETLAFTFFALSDNWREELKQIKPRVDFIRKVSPRIYSERLGVK